MTDRPTPSSNSQSADSLLAWLAAALDQEPVLPEAELPVEAAERDGVLPWLGFRLQDSSMLEDLSPEVQQALRTALRHCNILHLACEGELERLAGLAAERNIRFLVFKGHSVARTLYPHPACRTTVDFDILVDPAQLPAARDWLTAAGYAPTDPFAGTLWLGAQNWSHAAEASAAFHVDLHWDYTNRMYFRRRLIFGDLWAGARQVACGGTTIAVPSKVDDLLIACVHLAAFDPGLRIRLIWLLDIYLLMAALEDEEIPLLVERAGRACAVEACLEFGRRAAELGDPERVEPVLEALRGAANMRRWRGYQRTLRWRAWDLACYWGRLSIGEKVRFFGEMGRWILVR